MNTQDAIRIAEIETTETRNRRGWTPEEIRSVTATPANRPEFNQVWQALMRQLETVLSIAHEREPNRTRYREAISIAKHHLTRLDTLAD
jgi:hypothetical protein